MKCLYSPITVSFSAWCIKLHNPVKLRTFVISIQSCGVIVKTRFFSFTYTVDETKKPLPVLSKKTQSKSGLICHETDATICLGVIRCTFRSTLLMLKEFPQVNTKTKNGTVQSVSVCRQLYP